MTNRLHKRADLTSVLCCVLCCFLAGSRAAVAQNVVWGPFHLNLGFQAGFAFTDNVDTSEKNPKSDFKLLTGPTIDGVVLLPFTGPNGERLTLSAGVSYQYEVSLTGNSTANNFSAPVSVALVLPIQLHNWLWVAADTFALHNDPLERTVAVSENESKELSNVASIGVTRNFGKIAVTLQGFRTDRFSPDQPDLEETQYQAAVTPAYFFRENYSIFWRNSVGRVEPGSSRPSSVGWASEVGLNGQITPYLSGTISIGFAHSHLESIKLGPGDGIFGGIFDRRVVPEDNVDGISSTLSLSYSHPLRPNTTYSLSFFRSPGVTAVLNESNIQAIQGANLAIAHRLNSRVILQPGFNYTHVEDVGNQGAGEVVDLFSASIQLTRDFTSRLSGRLNYRYQIRSSNIALKSYEANRIDGSLHFTF